MSVFSRIVTVVFFIILSVTLTSCGDSVVEESADTDSSMKVTARTYPSCPDPDTYTTITSFNDYNVWSANPVTSARFSGAVNMYYGSIVPYTGCRVEIESGATISNCVNVQITAGSFINNGSLDAMANIMITTADTSVLNAGSSMHAAGAIMITSDNTMTHNGSLTAAGSVHLTSQTLNFGSTGYLYAAGDIAIDLMGSSVSTFEGTIENSNSLDINGINLDMTSDGEIKGNGTTEIVVTGTLNDATDIMNNGDVCISAGYYSLNSDYEFTSNTSCVIGGNILSGSLPLTGCTRGYAACGGGSPECTAGQEETQSCGDGGTQTRVCENGLWGEWGECSVSEDPCENYECGANSHCEVINETATCVCDTDYTDENGTCINSKEVNCTDNAPANATSTVVPVTITYTTANGWSTPSECAWNCNTDYISEKGITCINSKEVDCVDNAPANATSTVVPVTITYTTANGWSTPPECSWNCNTDYISEDSTTCINSKEVNCTDNAPANATSTIAPVTITYTTANGWTTPPECSWSCNTDYILSVDASACINSQQVDCVDNAPANATSTITPVTITYTTANGWSTPSECAWNCNTDYISEDSATCINSKEVDCTDNAPANAASTIAPVTITYTTANGWTTPADCAWTCNEGYIVSDNQCVEETLAVCENVTCSGIGTCVVSSIFAGRFGDYREDKFQDISIDSEGYVAFGGYTGSEDSEQLYAVIKDSLFNDILIHQNNESVSNELRAVTSFGTTFYLLMQSNSQKIVGVDHFGMPFSEVELFLPFGISYIDTAPDGNIIIAGKASDTELHVSKITTDGTQIWDEVITSTTVQDMRIEDISVYQNGDIAVVGRVEGDLFGPSSGSNDIFVSVYDVTGIEKWNIQLGTDSSDNDPAISFDNNGDVVITFITEGAFSGSNLGFMDAAVAKFSGVDGTELWRTQFGTAAFDAPFDITVSPEGQIFVAGATLGSMGGNVNEGEGIYGMNTADIFVTELDGNGTEYSTFTYGDIPHDWFAEKIEAVGDNVVYLAGNTGHLSFEEGIMFSDMFLLKVDLLGRNNYPQCECPAGYVNINNECVAEESCDNIDCGAYGTCEIKNLRATCLCDEGYEFDGTTCSLDLCAGIDCSGYGQCEVVDNTAVCNCYENFTNDGDPLQCINQKNVMCDDSQTPQNATSTVTETTIWYDDTNGWSQPSECVWECNYGYDQDGWACVNQKNVSCVAGVVPDNAYTVYTSVVITYDPVTGWTTPEECEWSCYWGYTSDDGETCINQKDVACIDNSPENAHPTVTTTTIYYDSSTGTWPDAGECPWECDLDYDLEWGTENCRNEMQVDCYAGYLPQNAYFPVNEVQTLTYTTAEGWTWPEQCDWECVYGYITEDNNTCINQKDVACIEYPEPNTVSVQEPITIFYDPATGWSDPATCNWTCAADYISEDGITCINQKYVSCTGYLDNAHPSEPQVLITYSSTNGWSTPEECTWVCNENYTMVDETCVADTRTVDCQNTKPDITVWSDTNPDGQLVQTWSGSEWLPSENECSWECEVGYYYNGECTEGFPPFEPSNPMPYNDETNVPFDSNVILSWDGGDPLGENVIYTVKYGTELPPETVICRDISTESCDAGLPVHGKDYFWQVVATNSSGRFITGPIWHFTAEVDGTDGAPVWLEGTYIDYRRIGSAGMELRWTPAIDDNGIVKYNVYINDKPFESYSPSQLKTVEEGGTTLLSAVIIPLVNDTGYNFRVEACDISRCTQNGPTISAVTESIENTVIQKETLDASSFIKVADRVRSYYRETPGTEPIQHFVNIDPEDDYSPILVDRVSVITGEVLDTNGTGVSDVLVYVKDHPEFGYTYTRSGEDAGKWTMIVNGGTSYIFVITTPGYLPAERGVFAPVELSGSTDKVVLTSEPDTLGTIDLSQEFSQSVETVSHNDDGRGERKALVVVNPETEVYALYADGGKDKLETITIGHTEYTRHPEGRDAMPAPLTPNIGYTYCMEIVVQEAPDAQEIVFSRPVYYYLDNFLNFPVGTAIPNGRYDRKKGSWVGEKDGVVISIVSIRTRSDGIDVVDIDVNGDGIPESSGDLFNLLEITESELELLAQKYGTEVSANGAKQLWRAPISHFSWIDLNLAIGIIDGAISPELLALTDESDPDDMDCPTGTTGSQIECESRILGERIRVPGTEYTLHYRSGSSGRLANRKVNLELLNLSSYSSIEPELEPAIKAEMADAGEITVDWSDSENAVIIWDGKDSSGNPYNGNQKIRITTSYPYPARYQCEGYSKGGESFADPGGLSFTGTNFGEGGDSAYIVDTKPCGFAGIRSLSTKRTIKLYNHTEKPGGLGGLTLDVNNKYDISNDRLYRGNGTIHSVDDYLDNIITSVAEGYSSIMEIITLPTGEIVFYAYNNGSYLFKINHDGTIEKIAGGGSESYRNGMSPLDVSISVVGLATDKIGRIYFSDASKNRVLMIDTDGLLYTIAGTGNEPPEIKVGDGLPATEVPISGPGPIAVSSNGTIYFSSDTTIRYIDQNGILHSLLPEYMGYPLGNRWYADIDLELTLDEKMLIFLGRQCYHSCNKEVGSVNLEGDPQVTSLAVSGHGWGYAYDLYPAGTSDNLKFYFSNSSKIEYWEDGTIETFVGSSTIGNAGDGGLVKNAEFGYMLFFTFTDDGKLFIADTTNQKVRKVGPAAGSQVIGSFMLPDPGTGEILSFDHYGRHLNTLDSVTGTTVYSFDYELETVPGMDDYVGTVLSSVTNIDGEQTVFDRTDPYNIRIVSPDGDESYIVLNADGLASQFINPDGSSYFFNYTEYVGGKLLSRITYPNGIYTDYTFDDEGRLEKVIDQKTTEAEPYKQFSPLETSARKEWRTLYETVEGKDTTYVYTDNGVTIDRSVTRPDGTVTAVNFVKNQGKITRNENDGDIQTTVYETEDPRFGYHLPYVNSHTVTSGTHTMSVSREKSAVLSDPLDFLSHETLTDTTTINGKTWTNEYSDTEKSWTFTTPESRISKRYINDKGRTTLIENPDIENVSFTYRTDGKIETISQGTGTEERILTIAYYNSTDETTGALKGEVSTIIDPINRTVDFEYDLMGRVLRKTFEKGTADERIVEYTYDASGNVLTVKPAGKPVHNFYYDTVDLPDIYEAPFVTGITEEERRTEYTYNLDRQVEDIVRPDGTAIHLTYELLKEGYAESTGKLQKITVPGRGDIELAYETTGGKKLSTVSTPEGDTLTYTYDGALMTSESWSGNVTGTVSRTYNNDFQTTGVTVGTDITGYTYDNDGLLLTAGDMTITRDAETGLVTGTALDAIATTQTYNTFGEIATYDAGDYSYSIVSRDNLGRITEKDETVQGITTTYQYTYDKAGRLETVTENGLLTNQYTYDSNGNRTSKNGITATYDQQDRLLSNGYSTYTYTANGDLETETNVSGTTTYTHDALGNLTQVNLPNNDVISYTYDGRNRLISKVVNGTTEYRLIYAGQLSPIAKVDATGTVLETYVYGLGVNSPDYIIKDGTQYKVIKDHLGSMRMIVDSITGTIEKSITYDEFGNITNETGTFDTIFGYAGGIRDTDTGLTKFGARWYDPVTGRWIEKEPLGFEGSDNFYSYCEGDPVNRVDFNGLYWLDDLSNLAAGFGDYVSGGFLDSWFGIEDAKGGLTSYIRSKWSERFKLNNESVDPCSFLYGAGEWAGIAWETAFLAAIGSYGAGYRTRIAVHGPHHAFGRYGRLSHIQMNAWKQGVKGSGKTIFRLPLPWR